MFVLEKFPGSEDGEKGLIEILNSPDIEYLSSGHPLRIDSISIKNHFWFLLTFRTNYPWINETYVWQGYFILTVELATGQLVMSCFQLIRHLAHELTLSEFWLVNILNRPIRCKNSIVEFQLTRSSILRYIWTSLNRFRLEDEKREMECSN